jgi:hypothetical protein
MNEHDDQRDLIETRTLRDEVEVTEDVVFPLIQESATHKLELEAEAPILNLAKDKEC